MSSRMRTGTRLGDYAIDAELPATPNELAFLATHLLLPRRARVSVLHPTLANQRELAVAMMREACVLEALRCTGVPRVYECGLLPDRRPWTAIEYVEGPTISELTRTHALPASTVLVLLREAATVLDHAHSRGVIHRNIRPHVVSQNAYGLVLTDWADARTRDASDRDPAALPREGLEYRAPELITRDDYDGRADIYALGVVAYEALALSLPMAVPLALRCPSLPARLAELVDRMISVDPIARPSAAEVRAEAGRIADALAGVNIDVDDLVVEEVEVELVDIAEPADPSPIAGIPPETTTRIRWTPPDAYMPRADTIPIGAISVRKRPT
jgi:serine/threonine protein kinase